MNPAQNMLESKHGLNEHQYQFFKALMHAIQLAPADLPERIIDAIKHYSDWRDQTIVFLEKQRAESLNVAVLRRTPIEGGGVVYTDDKPIVE